MYSKNLTWEERRIKERVNEAKYRESHQEKIKQWQQKYYDKNRDKYLKKHKEKIRQLKIIVLSHYSNNAMKCAYCDENRIECLQLDHINNDGADHRRKNGGSGWNVYRWIKQNNFPKGFQVLCASDNFYKAFHPEWRGEKVVSN